MTEFLDLEHDVQQQVYDSIHFTDQLLGESLGSGPSTEEFDGEAESMKELEVLYRQASVPVCRVNDSHSSFSVISTVIVIMTMCTIHGVSNAFTDELLKYLSTTFLPRSNSLPSSFYYAKNAVQKMGLQYNVIHCCPAGHVIFRGEFEELDACPHRGCGMSRWMPGSTTIASKVLCHFSLIPRLRRMYRLPAIAKLLKWASKNKTGTAEMRSMANSPAGEYIDNSIDTKFSTEGRHLRMGLSLDGMNPFSMQRSTHSIWPVMVLLYNLPPWLVTKNFFVSLSLLLSGKESPTSKNIDVYLSPLVEELERLWEGIPVFDALANTAVEVPCFNMRGILMWTVFDFPARVVIDDGRERKPVV
jgi:hypothetical protein